jgi:uncharacterized protein (DUF2147 family)
MLFSLSAFGQDCNVCGLWYPEENHNSTVEIFVENGELKGRIAWMKSPNLANGQPIRDSLNKKTALRSRTIMDMVFLYGFEKDDDTWEKGKVYNSRNGKTYDAEIKLTDEGQLKLTGYIGMSWLGKSVYWDRVKLRNEEIKSINF